MWKELAQPSSLVLDFSVSSHQGEQGQCLGGSRVGGVGRGFGELHLGAASALLWLLCGRELPALSVPRAAAGWGN